MENVQLDNIWEDWRILSPPIGSGSFGTVYRAKSIQGADFHREYFSAVKVIRIPSDDSEIRSFYADGMNREEIADYYRQILDGLTEEIVLMQSLKGAPNIVIIEDFKVRPHEDGIGWTIYIRMELLKSITAYRLEHPLTVDDIVRLGTDMCSALEYCEKKHIIHRDIKPENIFVNDFGDFKLGDFGIARQLSTTSGSMSHKGTENYMAPEIFKRMHYDATVDIYSLGMVMYRYLNGGRAPFISGNSAPKYAEIQKASARRMSGEPLPHPMNGDEALWAIVLKACEPLPENRYQSPADMKEDLFRWRFEHKAGQSREILADEKTGVKVKSIPSEKENAEENAGSDGTVHLAAAVHGDVGKRPETDTASPKDISVPQAEAPFSREEAPISQGEASSPQAEASISQGTSPSQQAEAMNRQKDQASTGEFGQADEPTVHMFMDQKRHMDQKRYTDQGTPEPEPRHAETDIPAKDTVDDRPKSKFKRNLILSCAFGGAALLLFTCFVPVQLDDSLLDMLRYRAADAQTRAQLFVDKGEDATSGSTAIAYYRRALEADPECLDALIGALDEAYYWADQDGEWEDVVLANTLDLTARIGACSASPDSDQQIAIKDYVDYNLYYDGIGQTLQTAIEDGNIEGLDLAATAAQLFANYDQVQRNLAGKADINPEKEYRYEEILDRLYESGISPELEQSLLSQALSQFPENEDFLDRQAEITDEQVSQLEASVDEALSAGDTVKAYEICASMEALDAERYSQARAKIDEQVLTSTESAINDALNQGNIQGAYDLCSTMEGINAERFEAAKTQIQNFENTQNFLNTLKGLMDARDYEGMKNTIQADETYRGNTYYLVDGIYRTSVESGTGLIYDSNGIYYGAIENNIRKGQGIQFRLYSEGEYRILEGAWDGQANGEGTKTCWDGNGTQYVVSGNFTDGYENGTMTITWSSSGYNWSSQYTAVNGTIQTDGEQNSEGKYIYARAYASDGASAWWEVESLENFGFRLNQ